MRPNIRKSVQTNELEHVPWYQYTQAKWCLRHNSSGLFVVLTLPAWVATCLPLASPSHHKDASTTWFLEIQLTGILFYYKDYFFSLDKHIALLIVRTKLIFFVVVFSYFFQKPKQKDWHPPGGFILGLWALIIMVFFKTYGIKHMKHVFWTGANKILALAATLGSWVSPVFSACGLWLCPNTVLTSHF